MAGDSCLHQGDCQPFALGQHPHDYAFDYGMSITNSPVQWSGWTHGANIYSKKLLIDG